MNSQFIFRTIDNNYTIQIIKNIKTSRSSGHDGISSELLKLINNDISACITLIINQSIKSGIFPDRLKIAKINMVTNKISKTLGILYRLKDIFPEHILLTIYQSLIASHMNYGLLIWGIECHRLEKVQKKALRLLTNSKGVFKGGGGFRGSNPPPEIFRFFFEK